MLLLLHHLAYPSESTFSLEEFPPFYPHYRLLSAVRFLVESSPTFLAKFNLSLFLFTITPLILFLDPFNLHVLGKLIRNHPEPESNSCLRLHLTDISNKSYVPYSLPEEVPFRTAYVNKQLYSIFYYVKQSLHLCKVERLADSLTHNKVLILIFYLAKGYRRKINSRRYSFKLKLIFDLPVVPLVIKST